MFNVGFDWQEEDKKKTFYRQVRSVAVAMLGNTLSKWCKSIQCIQPYRRLPQFKKYIIDEMANQKGLQILRLPPYHCSLNPIELAWASLKWHVRKLNVTHHNGWGEAAVDRGNCTIWRWEVEVCSMANPTRKYRLKYSEKMPKLRKCVEHVEKEVDKYLIREGIPLTGTNPAWTQQTV